MKDDTTKFYLMTKREIYQAVYDINEISTTLAEVSGKYLMGLYERGDVYGGYDILNKLDYCLDLYEALLEGKGYKNYISDKPRPKKRIGRNKLIKSFELDKETLHSIALDLLYVKADKQGKFYVVIDIWDKVFFSYQCLFRQIYLK